MILSTPLKCLESPMMESNFCNDNNNNGDGVVKAAAVATARTLPPTPPQRLQSVGPGDSYEQQQQQKESYHVVEDLSSLIIFFSPPPKIPSRNRFSVRQLGESPILQLRECIRRNQQLNQLQSTSCHPNLNNSTLSIDHNDTTDGDRLTPCAPSKINKQQSRSVTDSTNIVFPNIESIQYDVKIRSKHSRESSSEYLLNEQKNPIYDDIPPKKPTCNNNEEKNNDFSHHGSVVFGGDSISYFETSVANLDFDYELHHKSEYEYRSRFNAPPRRRSTMSFSRVSSVSSITCGDYDYDDTECYEYGYGYNNREEIPIIHGVIPTSTSSLTHQPASPSPSPRVQVSPSTRRLGSRDFFGKHMAATATTQNNNNGCGCCAAPKAPRRRSTLHYYFPDIDENFEQEAVKNADDQ